MWYQARMSDNGQSDRTPEIRETRSCTQEDLENMAVSDLEFRARLAATWGIPGGREIVARAASRWAEGVLSQ